MTTPYNQRKSGETLLVRMLNTASEAAKPTSAPSMA